MGVPSGSGIAMALLVLCGIVAILNTNRRFVAVLKGHQESLDLLGRGLDELLVVGTGKLHRLQYTNDRTVGQALSYRESLYLVEVLDCRVRVDANLSNPIPQRLCCCVDLTDLDW